MYESIRVAIIDDDWSQDITYQDIVFINREFADSLLDKDDFLYDKIATCLKNEDPNIKLDEDIIYSSLANEKVQTLLLDDQKKYVYEAIERKKSFLEPLNKVKNFFIENTIQNKNIDIIHSHSDEKLEKEIYDIVCIDYFFKDNSENETLSILSKMLSKNNNSLFILMSSHTQRLEKDIEHIRTKLEISKARFRLLSKPMKKASDLEQEIKWNFTIKQLLEEKKLIPYVESFIKSWQKKIKLAADKVCKDLWEIDCDSINKLYITAKNDNIDLESYIPDILSKQILSNLEAESVSVTASGVSKTLNQELANIDRLRPSHDLIESRSYLYDLIKNISWEGRVVDRYNTNQFESPFSWFKSNIRFGTVITINDGAPLINLTQPCDLTQGSDSEKTKLLFIKGDFVSINLTAKISNKIGVSYACKMDGEWKNIHWNFLNPEIRTLQSILGKVHNIVVVGTLRQEQAQSLVHQFTQQVSRIGLVRQPEIGCMQSIFVKVINIEKNNITLQRIDKKGNDDKFPTLVISNTSNSISKTKLKVFFESPIDSFKNTIGKECLIQIPIHNCLFLRGFMDESDFLKALDTLNFGLKANTNSQDKIAGYLNIEKYNLSENLSILIKNSQGKLKKDRIFLLNLI
ncbi:hypothetical protein A9G13_00505 [Gilliamella sp. wkB178]|uniref:hypothetical protein n=1 Tax=Gilliamella sp. wkB178 TaxID=3120259 RepID=UPI00080DE865|nr:hypothetical protein [Gilliamella apicola]OCG10254.1 hypothetical protein A9G13_00505 [Gilliamella apicola]